MLKILVVLLPMVVGASLAGVARAATPLEIASQPAAVSVQSTFSALPAVALSGFQNTSVATSTAGFDAVYVNRDTSHLPEPATWAIMLAGFGLVGGAARHRRAHRHA